MRLKVPNTIKETACPFSASVDRLRCERSETSQKIGQTLHSTTSGTVSVPPSPFCVCFRALRNRSFLGHMTFFPTRFFLHLIVDFLSDPR